jgi:pantoate--beta-alanine ligase
MRRLATEWRRRGTPVGLVPTMGFLHRGHLSLVNKARARVGSRGIVVLSIYVNPTQFAPTEDLANYPRDLPRDKKLCRDSGVDVLFVPDDKQMYPSKDGTAFSTFAVEEALSRRMEGSSRPAHFRGVTTVVAKLLNIVLPEVAVFGAKDFQQAKVVKRMVRDLNFPVKIIVGPTVREPDGLALSSRNKYLSPDERAQAVALWQAIQRARKTVRTSRKPIASVQLRSELTWLIETRSAARVDYIEFFDPETFEPVPKVRPGTHLALAVFVGRTRLIDNGPI